MDNVQLGDLHFELYIKEQDIRTKVKELAREITNDYKDRNPIILCVLNGSFIFTADLVRFMEMDCEIQFVKLKSYSGTESTGIVEELLEPMSDINGREVIIVEDIVDTGNTLAAYIPKLQYRSPKSIKIVSLLFKKEALVHPLDVHYYGFEIPNKFVVGYGLDYNQKGRSLEHIYQLKSN